MGDEELREWVNETAEATLHCRDTVNMPSLVINTNQPLSKVPPNFLKEATDLIASELSKPASFVFVHVRPDQYMSFGGSTEPCACVDLSSIGKIGPEFNERLAEVLGKFVSDRLEVPQNRFYINFYDLPRHAVGWNGKTFAQ